MIGDNSNLATNYLFAGQQYDSGTDLYSMRVRYYDAGVGRFTARDMYPYDFANPIELNRYVYTANNPVNWIDPSGLSLVSYVKRLKSNVASFVKATGNYLRANGKELVKEFILGATAAVAGYTLANIFIDLSYRLINHLNLSITLPPQPNRAGHLQNILNAGLIGGSIAVFVKIFGQKIETKYPDFDVKLKGPSGQDPTYSHYKSLGYNHRNLKRGKHITDRNVILGRLILLGGFLGGVFNETLPIAQNMIFDLLTKGYIDLEVYFNEFKDNIGHHAPIVGLFTVGAAVAPLWSKSDYKLYYSIFLEGIVAGFDTLGVSL